MLKEILILKTSGLSGVESDFLVDGGVCELHGYEYTAERMGAHRITATLKCRECLDRRWTGREHVVFGGNRYFLDGTPSSSKDNSDHRYSHSLTFMLELDRVLSGTMFLDAVSGAEQDRPRSNTTSFSFYGTIREFSRRLTEVMDYAGLGVVSRVADEIPEGESLLLSFDDRTVLEAVQDAFGVFGVPYWYDLSGQKPCIVFGFVHNAITTPLKYGENSPLLKIERTNAGQKAVNRCTGYGSGDNIPYYYPNLSPAGDIEAVTNRGGLTVRIADPVKAARIIGQPLSYSKDAGPVVSVRAWFSVNAYNKTLGLDQTSLDNEVRAGQQVAAREKRRDSDGDNVVYVYLPAGYYTNSLFEMGVTLFVTAPCRVKFGLTLSTQQGMTGSRWSLCSVDGGSELAGGYSREPEINISDTGAYRLTVRNRISSGTDIYLSNYDGIFGEFSGLKVTGSAPMSWKKGQDSVSLGSCGLEIVSGTPQEGDTITVRNIAYGDGVRKYPACSRLMPYIYRETVARGRFYDAVNSKEAFVQRYADLYPESAALEGIYDRIYGDGDGHIEFLNPIERSTAAVEHIVTLEEIKPTITGMTNAAGGRMDELAAVDFDTDDDDSTLETDESKYAHPNFFIRLPKLDGQDGFNIFDHALGGAEMQISMTSGPCAGCSFPIRVAKDGRTNLVKVRGDGTLDRDGKGNVLFDSSGQPVQNDTRAAEVWLCLEKDTTTYGEMMPCRGKYEPQPGDTFVITGISLPDGYVFAAEKRLEAEIVRYMAENNAETYNFSVGFSRVFTASDETVMPLLDENATVLVEYDGRTYTMYVSQYVIRAREDSPIPEVSITVAEKVSDNTDAIRQAVSQAKSDMEKAVSGIDVTRLGLPYFLRKDIDDTAKGRPTFLNGLRVGNYTPGLLGTGGALGVDSFGNSTAEVDFLNVRKKAVFNELEIQKTKSVGGQLIVSCASMEITSVTETEDAYRCFFRSEDGNGDAALNLFREGDLAMARSFDAYSPTFWWRKVVSIGTDYMDLSRTDCADGSGIPRAGDTAVQLGNVSDTSRQSAQILSCYGQDAPSFHIHDGIAGYSLEGTLRSGFDTVDGKASFFVFGKGYIGDAERKQYIESKDGNLTVTGIINALGGVMSGLLAVKDADENIRAGFSGGDAGKTDEHGRMVMFGGADNTKETTDEQIAGSRTKMYEDGHLVTESAEVKGKLDAEILKFADVFCSEVRNLSYSTPEQGWNIHSLVGQNDQLGRETPLSEYAPRFISEIAISDTESYFSYIITRDKAAVAENDNIVARYGIGCSAPTPAGGTSGYVFGPDGNLLYHKVGGPFSRHMKIVHAGGKAASGKNVRVGMEADCSMGPNETGQNYAFMSKDGMFAGLRPKIIRLTGGGQIGKDEGAAYGDNTLRDIDHTVIVESQGSLTLYLPKAPLTGQHYEIMQVLNGLSLTVNGNGKKIYAIGASLLADAHTLDGKSRWVLDYVDGQWYLSYTVY